MNVIVSATIEYAIGSKNPTVPFVLLAYTLYVPELAVLGVPVK
jgi:hypothetical protein